MKRRLVLLKRLRNEISANEEEIIAALAEDLGKSRTEAYMTEIGMTLSELSCAIRNLKRWSKPRRVWTPLAQFPATSRIIPEPYGNVLIMSPWNYPFLLCMSPLVSAMAAGNTVILKPSAYSPATSAAIKKLVNSVFTEEEAAVVEGGREDLTPVTLELGGKSPVIVTPSADIRVSAARIVFGKFLNCGQTCVAPDYVIIHESIVDSFVENCKREILGMYGLDQLANPDYGKIINRKHFDRLCDTMDEVRQKCVFGGFTDPGRLKISPAVFRLGSISARDCDSVRIMQDEIFGPLLPVLTYSDPEEITSYVESHPRPLAVYIFASDRKQKEFFISRLHFGGGCVNDTIIHLASEALPFGGVGESGMGHYHGRFGFETFSHLKSIVDKPFWLDLPMRYQPYSSTKEKLIKRFLK